MKNKCSFVVFLLVVVLFASVLATLGPDDRKSKAKKSKSTSPSSSSSSSSSSTARPTTVSETKLADSSVMQRGLVKKNFEPARDIIKYHKAYCSSCTKQHKELNILGYVTPWNSHGYDMAKTFGNKINIISPVWLQIKRDGRNKYSLTGTHDIDADWLAKVSSNGTRILPRILFEKIRAEDLHALFNNEAEIESLVKMLLHQAAKYSFDGYVFEIYIQLGGHSKQHIAHILTDLADALHKTDRQLILVIPPALTSNDEKTKPIFDRDDFDALKDVVDGFSLMTYDYASHVGMIGPNSPLDWIEKNVVYFTDDNEYRAKIFMGMNFYGMKYYVDSRTKAPEPLLGSSLVDMLKSSSNSVQMKFDEESQEHMFLIQSNTDRIIVFYPTLYSINKRIELALSLGTGLSIWEMGQGLDYFYDLF